VSPIKRGGSDGSGTLRSPSSAKPGANVSTSSVPPIGARIREERVRRGVTVRGLAREVGVSASLISQIETSKSQPSVSTLYAITNALEVSIEDLFAPAQEVVAEPVAAAPAGAVPEEPIQHHLSTSRPIQTDRQRRVGPVVHPEQREAIRLETGVVWELLGQVPDVHVDFLLVTYQPGGSSSTEGTLMRHMGTEFGFIVSGALILTLGFDEHHLKVGDAFSFDSTMPHGYRNEGTDPAVGIWFVLERTR
jgi:transcriptional regulator with XRE-family HTH domain